MFDISFEAYSFTEHAYKKSQEQELCRRNFDEVLLNFIDLSCKGQEYMVGETVGFNKLPGSLIRMSSKGKEKTI